MLPLELYSSMCYIADLSVLNSCRRAQGAVHHHGSRRGCLKGTRETVLSEIESWANDFNQSPVFWLNGLAGTGKSTIAQTVSERVFADGQPVLLSSVPAISRTAAICASSSPPSPSSWLTSSQNFDPFLSPCFGRIRALHTSHCIGRWRSS